MQFSEADTSHLPNVRDMNSEDRQAALWQMSGHDLGNTLNQLMKDNRLSEQGLRLDALTIYVLKRTGFGI